MDDNALMARLRAGDTGALEELIRRHRSAAVKQAQAILHDAVLAEDMAQEAFARVYLLRHSYRPEFAFTTYLRVMVRNLCIDQLRRRAVAPVPMGELPPGEVDSAEAAYLARESRMQLWNSLRALPKEDQTLLISYAMEGKTYRELARLHGLSLPQVKIRLHRIRKRLKERDEP